MPSNWPGDNDVDHLAANGRSMSASSFGDRVRRKRTELDLSLQQLGDRLGVTNQAVHKWESGRSFPKKDHLIALATVLQTTVAFLLTGAGENRSITEGTLANPLRYQEGRVVPTYTPEQAIDKKSRPSNVLRFQTHFSCSDTAFQIPIWNRCNDPVFIVGDAIVIDPSEQPLPGDMVLAAIGAPPTPFFAKYTLTSATDVVLQPLNPDWPSQRFDATRDRIIGVMTEHSKPRRA